MKRFVPDIKSKFSYAWELFKGPTRLFLSVYKNGIDVNKVYNVAPIVNEIIYLSWTMATVISTIALPTIYLAVMVPHTIIKHAITNFLNTMLFVYNALKSSIFGKKAEIEDPDRDLNEDTPMFDFDIVTPEPTPTLRSSPILRESRDNDDNIGNSEPNTNTKKPRF